ncbi:hypothetical protein KY305_02575 [Bacillus sp. YC2]|uniref:ribonuclease toxin immunity protein CdiI n=1 Tax=Bacillus sp. YC2 TaxID=2861287 RepID=UPI001CA63CC2|nr:ribonuclease toxin immunity protein CdiI [Bacillus sp. YC2]MBY8911645.1 hypothetical protein [Bacillus sp. YC2]
MENNKDIGPMIDYFNSITDREFLKVLKNFAEELGYGDEYHLCTFASSMEPWEEDYFENGVEFLNGTAGEDVSVIVDYLTFYHYLTNVSDDYLKRVPEHRDQVIDLLEKIKQNYDITN